MVVVWSEVAEDARGVFEVWNAGKEMEWAEWAWCLLAARGLTTYTDEVERHEVLVRLMCLGVIYREFCWCAWEEHNEPNLREWAESLWMSPFRIAQMVGPAFARDREDEDDALQADALIQVVGKARREVIKALRAGATGDAQLFASLWLTNDSLDLSEGEDEADDQDRLESLEGPEARRPPADEAPLTELLDDEDVLAVVVNDVTADKMAAFEWVAEGMPELFD